MAHSFMHFTGKTKKIGGRNKSKKEPKNRKPSKKSRRVNPKVHVNKYAIMN
jgi:hypothetical protein